MTCPLCLNDGQADFARDKNRSYLQCLKCQLVYVPRAELVSEAVEKERYDSHQNSDTDSYYTAYLQKIVDSSLPYLTKCSTGLDFGCGKVKLLEKLLIHHDFQVSSYDLFFHPAKEVLERRYDFIIMSEVIEHLRAPYEELKKLSGLLNETGILIIKTKKLPETKIEFSDWFYKRDKTHVQFFTHSSFERMCDLFNLKFEKEIGEDLFLFRKNPV